MPCRIAQFRSLAEAEEASIRILTTMKEEVPDNQGLTLLILCVGPLLVCPSWVPLNELLEDFKGTIRESPYTVEQAMAFLMTLGTSQKPPN